jgi:hypothetical protein
MCLVFLKKSVLQLFDHTVYETFCQFKTWTVICSLLHHLPCSTNSKKDRDFASRKTQVCISHHLHVILWTQFSVFLHVCSRGLERPTLFSHLLTLAKLAKHEERNIMTWHLLMLWMKMKLYSLTLTHTHTHIADVWGWQVGRLPQALLLRGPHASGLRLSLWVCQAIFSGKLEMLINVPFKILQGQIP